MPAWRPAEVVARLSDGRAWSPLLLAPALIVVVAVVLVPTIYGVSLSFRQMRLTRRDLGTGFVGLDHYVHLLHDPVLGTALLNTAIWATAATLLELALGLGSALALNRGLPGLRAASVLILLPWFLPNVVAGNMWGLLLDARLGVVNDLLVRLGLLGGYKAWFADPATALAAATVVEAWHGFPFFTLLLLAALQGIPPELHEAAAIDGAGPVGRFRHVVLPLLRPVIAITALLRLIGLVNTPDLLLILTGGGPGYSTTVLSLYAFNTAYRGFDFGYAGALSVLALVILMLLAFGYVRWSGVAASAARA